MTAVFTDSLFHTHCSPWAWPNSLQPRLLCMGKELTLHRDQVNRPISLPNSDSVKRQEKVHRTYKNSIMLIFHNLGLATVYSGTQSTQIWQWLQVAHYFLNWLRTAFWDFRWLAVLALVGLDPNRNFQSAKHVIHLEHLNFSPFVQIKNIVCFDSLWKKWQRIMFTLYSWHYKFKCHCKLPENSQSGWGRVGRILIVTNDYVTENRAESPLAAFKSTISCCNLHTVAPVNISIFICFVLVMDPRSFFSLGNYLYTGCSNRHSILFNIS